jgi:hypothetical protein
MIIRILGEGQYAVADAAMTELNALDDTLQTAVDRGDHPGASTALTALIDRVTVVGTALPDDVLEPSELFLPPRNATLAEINDLLADDGLIPG